MTQHQTTSHQDDHLINVTLKWRNHQKTPKKIIVYVKTTYLEQGRKNI